MPKITALTAKTSPATTDLIPIVDMTGTPTTKHSTIAAILALAAGGFTAGGDLTGTSSSQTVAKVNGAAVGTAAGALTAGNVLKVTGVSALDYGAVNLAGGANHVTGVLPAANQAAQTMGGDVTGTTAASVVAKINGVTISGAPTGANQYIKSSSTTAASWATIATGSSSVGSSGQANYSDGSSGWSSWTGVTGVSNAINVGVTGTPTTNGVRLANAYAISARNSAGTGDTNLCRNDASDNIFVGATSGTASTSLDSTSSTNLRVAGTTVAFAVSTSFTSNQPIVAGSGTAPTSGSIRVPIAGVANASLMSWTLSGGTTLRAIWMATTDQIAFGENGAQVWINSTQTNFGASGFVVGTFASNLITFSPSNTTAMKIGPTLIQNTMPRVGDSSPFASEGQVPIAITTAGKTLVAAEYSRKILKFTGSSGGSGTITMPLPSADDRSYVKDVRNTSTTDLNFSNTASPQATVHAGRIGRFISTPDGCFGFDVSASPTLSVVSGNA